MESSENETKLKADHANAELKQLKQLDVAQVLIFFILLRRSIFKTDFCIETKNNEFRIGFTN